MHSVPRSGCGEQGPGPRNAWQSSVPQTTVPHPSLQDEGLPRFSDERHWVSPSIINTSPGLLFSDWGLPNPLIIAVHQMDDSSGDNQWLFLACPPPHTLAQVHQQYICSGKGGHNHKRWSLSSRPHRLLHWKLCHSN